MNSCNYVQEDIFLKIIALYLKLLIVNPFFYFNFVLPSKIGT